MTSVAARTAVMADLTSCAQEPIHAPGAIQPHGLLIVADGVTRLVSHLSRNFSDWTGRDASAVLGKPLSELLGAEVMEHVEEALLLGSYISGAWTSLLFPDAPEPLPSLLAHDYGGSLFLEFEASTADAHDGDVAVIEAVMAKLKRIDTVEALCDHVVHVVRDLTGYDRVMVYRFDETGNGEVIAEERVPENEPFLGLRYPASDIPDQARALYLKQHVRQIVDVNYAPVAMIAGPGTTEKPLDMSFCSLRSVSPVHIEYLKNMGVGGTLTVSLVEESRLWGMIACHHRTPRHVPAFLRSIIDLLGQMAMLLIGKVSEREELGRRLETHDLIELLQEKIARADSVPEGLASEEAAILSIVAASGAVLRLRGRLHAFGQVPPLERLPALLNDIGEAANEKIVAYDAFGLRFPHYADLAAISSGVLYAPILNSPGDGFAWFRPELVRTVTWGGDPTKPVEIDPQTGRIAPRRSFAAWQELLRGHSAPWQNAEKLTVQEIRRVVTQGMLRHAEAQLLRLSTIDPLTGLANRRRLEEALRRWVATASRSAAALIFLDLDRFKTVNDSLGHPIGDELLVQVARRLENAVPSAYLLARLGGDEFVVFAEDDDFTTIEAVASAILKSFVEPFSIFGRQHRATASIGLAFSRPGGGDLLQEADVAMYASKRQGGNSVVTFQPSLHEVAVKTLRIEQDLFLALMRKEFVLHYQPIVNLANGALSGFEALVRWYNAERGWTTPADFIPRAEETGLIAGLGQWIMEQGISDLAGWPDPALRLSINVSPRQFRSGDFSKSLSEVLGRHDVAPARVIVEVTEGALVDSVAIKQLYKISELGCGLAIDDFGTGYSSLAYLRDLPVDTIKIDRSFVSPLGEDPKAYGFFHALVLVAHTLDLKVVAEGVETEAQLHAVIASGCDGVQGYLFGKPESTEAAGLYCADPGRVGRLMPPVLPS